MFRLVLGMKNAKTEVVPAAIWRSFLDEDGNRCEEIFAEFNSQNAVDNANEVLVFLLSRD